MVAIAKAVNQQADERQYFKVATLEKRWSLSKSKIYEMMTGGMLASVKFGTSRRVPRSAVEAFEAQLAAEAVAS